MATWVTPSPTSQSRNRRRSSVNVLNSRTCWARPPLRADVRTHAITVFWCTSSPAHRSTSTSMGTSSRRSRCRPEEPHVLKHLRLVLAATLQGAWRLHRQSDLRAHGTNEARRRRATPHFHPSRVAPPLAGQWGSDQGSARRPAARGHACAIDLRPAIRGGGSGPAPPGDRAAGGAVPEGRGAPGASRSRHHRVLLAPGGALAADLVEQ